MSDRNRREYDRHARVYHAKRADSARSFYNDQLEWPMMLKLLRGRVRGRKILELGCGSGLLTRKLMRMGGEVTGVDNSESMLAIARNEVSDARFVHADMRRVKAKAGEYDLVVSSLAFHYVQNLDGLFKRCSKLLRSNGALVFSIHHPLSSFKMLQEQQKTYSVYFGVGKSYRWRMLPGMELVSYHQTLESISEGLSRAGLCIDRMLEAKPSPGSRRINPQAFDAAMATPAFLAIRAVKPAKD